MITKSLTKNTIIPEFQTQTKTNRETQFYIKDKTKISFLTRFNQLPTKILNLYSNKINRIICRYKRSIYNKSERTSKTIQKDSLNYVNFKKLHKKKIDKFKK